MPASIPVLDAPRVGLAGKDLTAEEEALLAFDAVNGLRSRRGVLAVGGIDGPTIPLRNRRGAGCEANAKQPRSSYAAITAG